MASIVGDTDRVALITGHELIVAHERCARRWHAVWRRRARKGFEHSLVGWVKVINPVATCDECFGVLTEAPRIGVSVRMRKADSLQETPAVDRRNDAPVTRRPASRR